MPVSSILRWNSRNRCCGVLSQMLLWTSQQWKRCELRPLCHQRSWPASGLCHQCSNLLKVYVPNAPTFFRSMSPMLQPSLGLCPQCSNLLTKGTVLCHVLRKTHRNHSSAFPWNLVRLDTKLKCELKCYQKVRNSLITCSMNSQRVMNPMSLVKMGLIRPFPFIHSREFSGLTSKNSCWSNADHSPYSITNSLERSLETLLENLLLRTVHFR